MMETVFWTAAFLAMMSLEFPRSGIRLASLPTLLPVTSVGHVLYLLGPGSGLWETPRDS